MRSAICCHSFRATGITNYLLNGGTLEKAWRANIIQPFEKQYNVRVRVASGDSVRTRNGYIDF